MIMTALSLALAVLAFVLTVGFAALVVYAVATVLLDRT